jgi:hypothetical protein
VSTVRRVLTAPAIACAVLLVTGCTVEPWVKPYERDRMADAIMSFDRNPVSSSYTSHMREVREAAKGADGSNGGGCGCN